MCIRKQKATFDLQQHQQKNPLHHGFEDRWDKHAGTVMQKKASYRPSSTRENKNIDKNSPPQTIK